MVCLFIQTVIPIQYQVDLYGLIKEVTLNSVDKQMK